MNCECCYIVQILWCPHEEVLFQLKLTASVVLFFSVFSSFSCFYILKWDVKTVILFNDDNDDGHAMKEVKKWLLSLFSRFTISVTGKCSLYDVKSWTGSQLSYLLQVCWIACWNLNLRFCSSSQGVRSCSLKLLSTTQLAWMCEVSLNIELKFQYLAISCYHAPWSKLGADSSTQTSILSRSVKWLPALGERKSRYSHSLASNVQGCQKLHTSFCPWSVNL